MTQSVLMTGIMIIYYYVEQWGEKIMRKHLIILCLSALVLSGCASGTDDSCFLDNYVAYENKSILPGKMKWFISQDEVIDQMKIGEDVRERDDGQLVADNLSIPNVTQDDKKHVRFYFENGQFVSWEIFILTKSDARYEALFSGIIEWGKKNLPEPQVNTALWNESTDYILGQYREDENVSFIWNAEDMSYLRIDMTVQAEYLDDVYNIINLSGSAPREVPEGKQ